MLKKCLFPGLFLVLLCCTSAPAQVSITYSSQGKNYFSLAIPDNWLVNVGYEVDLVEEHSNEQQPMARIISAIPDDKSWLWFGMWVPPGVQNFKQAKEYMDSLDVELLSDVVFKDRWFETLNDMQAYYTKGTGKKNNEPMEFYGALVQIAEDNVAIAIYIGPLDATTAHKDELQRMLSSLQPITP